MRFLERAVELQPEDSTVNGHLGDAYMAAGRRREAEVQWRRALILNPEPQDEAALQAKLAGLPHRRRGSPRSAGWSERRLSEPAPAKVNLSLLVTGRRADGYHLLDSLVVFGPAADIVHARPATGLSLRVEGPFAAGLAAGAGQPGASGGPCPGGLGRAAGGRGAGAGEASAGRVRDRRRLGRRCGHAAAAVPACGMSPGRRTLAALALGLGRTCRSAWPAGRRG